MSPVSKEKSSRGEAKGLRRDKAEKRRNNIPTLTQQIMERLEVSTRLAEIGKLLSSDNLAFAAMKLPEKARVRAKLEFEEFWLKAKIGLIRPERQRALYVDKLVDWQQKFPDTYAWFIKPGEDGMSEADKIRNTIMPPRPRLAGYRTRG